MLVFLDSLVRVWYRFCTEPILRRLSWDRIEALNKFCLIVFLYKKKLLDGWLEFSQKIKILQIKVQSDYIDHKVFVLFQDADVMWFRDPFLQFDSNVDVQISCDAFNGKPFDLNNYPNNGFSFIRSNNRTIEFYKLWVSLRWMYPGQHDQDVFNQIKRDSYINKIGLTLKFLDTNYFGGFCTPSKDFNKVCTMHANCCVGLEWKITDLKIILEDWKRFLSSPNQTMSFHSLQN